MARTIVERRPHGRAAAPTISSEPSAHTNLVPAREMIGRVLLDQRKMALDPSDADARATLQMTLKLTGR